MTLKYQIPEVPLNTSLSLVISEKKKKIFFSILNSVKSNKKKGE